MRRPAAHLHLLRINAYLGSLLSPSKNYTGGSPKDIHVVDPELILADNQFCSYVKHINIGFAAAQAASLENVHRFIVNPNQTGVNQDEIARRCYRAWDIPLPEVRQTDNPATNVRAQQLNLGAQKKPSKKELLQSADFEATMEKISNPSLQQPQNKKSRWGPEKKKATTCWHDPNCTRQGCHFPHPKRDAGTGAGAGGQSATTASAGAHPVFSAATALDVDAKRKGGLVQDSTAAVPWFDDPFAPPSQDQRPEKKQKQSRWDQ
jgi:hypothetical protein